MINKFSLGVMVLAVSFGSSAITLDKTEVSNEQYLAYMQENKSAETPRYFKDFRSEFFKKSEAAKVANFDETTFTKPNYPVVGVSWFAAKDYCEWSGGRLPTREEWIELGGAKDMIWSWGNNWDYSKANTGGEFKNENDGFIYAAPVTFFGDGASPTGALNLSGNVAEWTMDKLAVGGSSKSTPSGASIKAFVSYEPEFRNFDLGFRCVR